MSAAPVPFPPSGGYIRAVRESARALRRASGVTIAPGAITRLLRAPALAASFPRLAHAHGLALPLAFPSAAAELNVLAVLSLINLGSGYRAPLHAHAGRGAWDAVRALVLGVYISGEGEPLSARAMRGMPLERVAALMGVPTHVERAHATLPGVVVGERGGPLYELALLVTGVLNETGGVLVEQGYPDLGSFVLEALREGERVGRARGEGVDVDVVLEKLVLAIPAFRDMSIVNGQPIYIFKKALFLINAIALRFAARPSSIPVPDTATLPIFADNVIPSMLLHLGILDVSECTSHALARAFGPAPHLDALLALPADSDTDTRLKDPPADGPTLAPDDAYVLRAAAIEACEEIVAAARGADDAALRGMTLPQVDAWLWAGAKDRADYRALPRFVLRDTAFF